MSSDARLAQLRKVQNQISGMIEDDKCYDALRLVVTISNRYVTSRNYHSAIDLAKDSAIALLDKGEGNLAAQVGEQLITILTKSQFPLNSSIESDLASIFRAFMKNKELIYRKLTSQTKRTPGADDSFDSSEIKYEDPAIRYMKSALAWSIKAPREEDSSLEEKKEKSSVNYPSILLSKLLAHYLASKESYALASLHYIKSNAPAAYASMLLQWGSKGEYHEADLFLTRGILTLLASSSKESVSSLVQRANEVHRIYNIRYKYDARFQASPLNHFCKLLIQAASWKDEVLFNMLKSKYEFSLTSKDTTLQKLVTKVGSTCFNIQAPKSLLDSFLGSD